jgi:arylsulfatase
MVYDASNIVNGGGGKEYQGYLRQDVETIAEILKKRYNYDDDPMKSTSGGRVGGGYNTYMVGKWHVGGEYPPNATHDWVQKTMGDSTHPTPTQRGFDMFYGTLGGGGSYYQPPSLVRNDILL